ncbi:MAG: class I SAM-dependent methyltransferase [Halanaerobium sp.]
MEINDKLSNNNQKFNQGAEDFEIWFKNNKNIFMTEFKALEKMVSDPQNCISIGIGNGLLAEKLGIKKGIEPSQAMAELARKKGIEVIEGRAEAIPLAAESVKQVLLGTILSYVDDKRKAVEEAFRILEKGGEVIISILPAEASFALLYRLVSIEGYYLNKISPDYPYPIEFLEGTDWISTEDLIVIMEDAGFKNLEFLQTLTKHPKYANESIEAAVAGYKKGDYVVVKGVK